jgi:hypothetical protein
MVSLLAASCSTFSLGDEGQSQGSVRVSLEVILSLCGSLVSTSA